LVSWPAVEGRRRSATQTFGFAGAVHHFLDRVRDRRAPLTSGAEAAKTQLLLDRILYVAGLPTEEQPGRVWASHAKNDSKDPTLTSLDQIVFVKFRRRRRGPDVQGLAKRVEDHRVGRPSPTIDGMEAIA
jgi:hypothetical protein